MTNPSPEQVEREIDATRDHMLHVIDAIQEQVSPRRLIHHAMDYARTAGESSGDFGRNLGRTIRDNPVPVVLVGAGLTWMAISSRSSSGTPHSGASTATGGMGQTVRSAADNMRSGAHEVGEKAGAAAREAEAKAAAVGDRAAEAANRIRAGAESAGQQAREYAQQAGRTAQDIGQRSADFAREHPFALAVAAVGAGALLAALIPQSRREKEIVGPAAHRAEESIRRTAERAGETAGEAVSRATRAASETAKEEGLTGERVGREGVSESAAEVAKSAGREASDAVREKTGGETGSQSGSPSPSGGSAGGSSSPRQD